MCGGGGRGVVARPPDSATWLDSDYRWSGVQLIRRGPHVLSPLTHDDALHIEGWGRRGHGVRRTTRLKWAQIETPLELIST